MPTPGTHSQQGPRSGPAEQLLTLLTLRSADEKPHGVNVVAALDKLVGFDVSAYLS